MANTDPELATTLAEVARALGAQKDLSAVVSSVCRLAVDTIAACDHADVMVKVGGTVTVPAASDWVGIRIVSLEHEVGEGPCLDAAREGTLVDVPDLEREDRWPHFVPRCVAETGVRSGLGLPLLVDQKPIGALDLYANRPHAFQAEDQAAAALFAAHAAVAFEAARARIELERAIASRDLIGQAKGILMAQSRVSADEAFEMLRRASQRLNQKVVAVAQELVDRTTPR